MDGRGQLAADFPINQIINIKTMDIDWFWVTCIVGIIALCVKSILESYFEYKYGQNKEEEEEE